MSSSTAVFISSSRHPQVGPPTVMAVELSGGQLLVIHAMELREHYREQYEEAQKWRV